MLRLIFQAHEEYFGRCNSRINYFMNSNRTVSSALRQWDAPISSGYVLARELLFNRAEIGGLMCDRVIPVLACTLAAHDGGTDGWCQRMAAHLHYMLRLQQPHSNPLQQEIHAYHTLVESYRPGYLFHCYCRWSNTGGAYGEVSLRTLRSRHCVPEFALSLEAHPQIPCSPAHSPLLLAGASGIGGGSDEPAEQQYVLPQYGHAIGNPYHYKDDLAFISAHDGTDWRKFAKAYNVTGFTGADFDDDSNYFKNWDDYNFTSLMGRGLTQTETHEYLTCSSKAPQPLLPREMAFTSAPVCADASTLESCFAVWECWLVTPLVGYLGM